jgi:hypothetical protein
MGPSLRWGDGGGSGGLRARVAPTALRITKQAPLPSREREGPAGKQWEGEGRPRAAGSEAVGG